MNKLFEVVGKGFPPSSLGKTFFVSATSGALWNKLNLQYPADDEGVTRVHTTITLALAQCTAGRGDVIILAEDFDDAITAAELASAQTKSVTILQSGRNQDGTWFAERAIASLPQSTRSTIFTVTGKVKILSLVGEVSTDIQNQACNLILSAQNDGVGVSATALASVALAAATSVASEPVGTIMTVTGTLSDGLSTSFSGVAAQANPILVRKGTIRLQASASNTGEMKWRIDYEPLEQGARVYANETD